MTRPGVVALLVIGAALAVWGGKSMLPRGIRNNNPGNLRITGDNWQGLAAQQTDPAFFQFVAPVYGIRALAKTLKTYYYSHGLTTIAEIISRYAPSTENNTGAYISAVAGALGVDPVRPLDCETHWPGLVAAIIYHENGQQPYSPATIEQGVQLA